MSIEDQKIFWLIFKKGVVIKDKEDRRLLWLKVSGAMQHMHFNKGYYEQLRDSDMNYPNPNFHQIEIDLKRTYPNVQDEQEIEKLIEPLRNVLVTYLKRSPTVGYC